jgi:hypothetical protein
MKKTTILAMMLCSITLAVLMSYVQGGTNSGLMILNSLAYLSAFMLIAVIHGRYVRRSESSDVMEELMRGLSRVSYYRSANLPVINSLKRAATSSSNERVSRILYETANRIGFGENFFDAISAATAKDKEIFLNLRRYVKSGESDIGEALLLYESKKKSARSRSNALMSRYATCGMFVTTIAPSFVIFSFIGSLLISQSASSTELMSIALVAAIPIAYSIINSMSDVGID